MDYPIATVREINGELFLDDPTALAVIKATSRAACRKTFEMQRDRVEHFVTRISALNLSTEDVVIVLANADDPNGKQLAEALMPNHDWQAYRNLGELPFARGLAEREGIQWFIEDMEPDMASVLKNHAGVAVVVVDHGVIEVLSPS